MKTTLEIPDTLFRKIKATAALEGKSLKEFVTEALRINSLSQSKAETKAGTLCLAGFPQKLRVQCKPLSLIPNLER